MRTEREILFDIEKLGYKYVFDDELPVFYNGAYKINLRRRLCSKRLEVTIVRENKYVYNLSKEDIKKKRCECDATAVFTMSTKLLNCLNELVEYYSREEKKNESLSSI